MDSKIQTPKNNFVTSLKLPHVSVLASKESLLYASSLNQINVFDLSSYTHVDTFGDDDDASGSVKSIAFTNTHVFTAHQDCKIRVWQVTPLIQHQLVSTLPTLKDKFLHFMVPKNYVNVRRHKKKLWIEHWDTVSGLAVHEGVMYSASWDKSFKLWNVKNNKCLESVKAHEDAVNSIVVSENGVVYTGSADGLIRVWEKSSSSEKRKHCLVTTLKKHKSTVNALALTSDGSMLFSGGSDCSVMVWERKGSGEDYMVFVEPLEGHTGAVLCLINMDRWIVSGSSDRTVRIWKRGMKSGYSCVAVLEGHERPVKSVVAIKRGNVCNNRKSYSICSGSLDGEIKIWDVTD